MVTGTRVAPIPVQHELSETDIAARLLESNSKVKLLVMDSELLHIAASIWNLAGAPRLITLDNSTDQQYASVESLLPRGNPDAEHLRFETEISLNDYDALPYRTP